MNTNEIVVKYLPIPLAVMVANIVLRVKPIEEIFAKQEYGADPLTNRSFLVTKHGSPVEPLGMAALLATSLEANGLDINLSGLRHALEAFFTNCHSKVHCGTKFTPILPITICTRQRDMGGTRTASVEFRPTFAKTTVLLAMIGTVLFSTALRLSANYPKKN